jgi:hypothetical protein
MDPEHLAYWTRQAELHERQHAYWLGMAEQTGSPEGRLARANEIYARDCRTVAEVHRLIGSRYRAAVASASPGPPVG